MRLEQERTNGNALCVLTVGNMLSECVKALQNGEYTVDCGAFTYAFYYGTPEKLCRYERFETGDGPEADRLVGEQTAVNRWMSQSIVGESTVLRIEARESLRISIASEADAPHQYTCWSPDSYFEYLVEGCASDGNRYLASLERRFARVKAVENTYAKEIELLAGDAFLLVYGSEFRSVKTASRWLTFTVSPMDVPTNRFDFDAMPAVLAARKQTVEALGARVASIESAEDSDAEIAKAARAVLEDAPRQLFRTRTLAEVERVARSLQASLDATLRTYEGGTAAEQVFGEAAIFEIPDGLEEDPCGRVIEPHFTVGDHMVLQRGKRNRLFGTTKDDRIAALFGGKVYYGSVQNREFTIELPPMEACEGRELCLVTPTACRRLSDVCVGEVFFVSGQSNMMWTLGMSSDAIHGADIQNATEENIRILQMTHHESAYERVDAEGNVCWERISPERAKTFSAVGYLFGKRMHRELGVPIGLVHAAVSGSTIACWLPRDLRAAYVKSGEPSYANEKFGNLTPCMGYNGMAAPLAGLCVGGMVWYQGEGNAVDGTHYFGQLSLLIQAYRRLFRDERLPITVVELPKATAWHAEKWPPVRAAQQRAAREIENVTMAVSIDFGHTDVHPTDKTEYARRVAEATLERFYGIPSAPFPRVAKAERIDGTTVAFTLEGGDGFVRKNYGRGFDTSSDGLTYTPAAKVTLEGNRLTVFAEAPIKAVRYGVRFYPNEPDFKKHLSIYNVEGNPLDQFYQTVD